MPANFCLMPETATKFKRALKDGTLDPNKMAKMSSAERNDLLSGIVGKNHAKAVNAEFERKILLKNQQRGYLTWAKSVSGIKPAARRDLIARIEKMQRVLDPEEGQQFMQDLTSARLGVDVTEAEAKTIADLSKNVTDAEALRGADGTFPNKETRMKYGYAVEDLTDYVAKLKIDAEKFNLADFKTSARKTANAGALLSKFTNKTAGNMKSLSASLDNSAIFRQGWKTLWTNPKIWSKNAVNTFSTLARTVGGKNVMREVNAEIISSPNYGRMVKAKLAIKNAEEAFPESLAEKIPALGRLYKASQDAYTGFVYKMRADVFDKYLEAAKNGGVDINSKEELEAIGNIVNSLTGRGNLGKLEPVANVVNNAFFSPRFLKANIDTFTQGMGAGGAKTKFSRAQARKNLIKITAGTATVLATADAIMPGSVEWDPRSSDFGKIRVGDTRIDVTGGMGSLLVLLARGVSQQSKSASSGKITNLNSDEFGSRTTQDVIVDFFVNKLSPAASTGKHLIEGKDFHGNDTDLVKEAIRALTPIGVQNANELFTNPDSMNPFAGVALDFVGLGTNTYSAAGGGGVSTWEKSSSKELKAFKEAVGEEAFKKSAKTFDDSYNNWISEVMKKDEYKKLSTDEQTSLIQTKKSQLKKDILTLSGFKYKNEKKSESRESLLK